MDLNWNVGVGATDAWAGSLVGALVALDSNQVTHLIVKRGLILSEKLMVPVHHLKHWDNEGLYLDTPISTTLDLCRLRCSDYETVAAVLTKNTKIHLGDGTRLWLWGLRVHQIDWGLTALVVGRSWLVRRGVLLPTVFVKKLSSSNVTLSISRRDLGTMTASRLDHDIENDFWETLHSSEELSEVDVKGLDAHVLDNVVTLTGNVRNSTAAGVAGRLARDVSGVSDVQNRIISDWDIELAVASFVSQEAPRLSESILIRTQMGTVRLQGHVTSNEERDAIIDGIRAIPGVRAVEGTIQVAPVAGVAQAESIGQSFSTEGETVSGEGLSIA